MGFFRYVILEYNAVSDIRALFRIICASHTDPFVKVHLFYKEKRLAKWNTSVKKNSLNPVYNESFSFDTDSKDANDLYVMLTVKDYDRIGKNDVIGYALIGEASSCESGRSQWAAMMKTLGEVTTFKHTLSL